MDGEAAIGNQWVAPDNIYYAKNMPIPKRDVAKAKHCSPRQASRTRPSPW